MHHVKITKVLKNQTARLVKVDSCIADVNIQFVSAKDNIVKMDKGIQSAITHINKDLEALDKCIDRRCFENEDLATKLVPLGTSGGVLSRYITSTLQGNGQCTQHVPTQYISSTFRISLANFPAISPAQEMVSTFRVSQVM